MRYKLSKEVSNPHWEALLDEQDKAVKDILGDIPFEIISPADYLKLLRSTKNEDRQSHPVLTDYTNLFIDGIVYVLGRV